MTSGMMSGAVIIPENSDRPRKRPKRTRMSPAIVPRMVANDAEVAAIRKLRNIASRI